jgi:PAS domain S-box-containing protein
MDKKAKRNSSRSKKRAPSVRFYPLVQGVTDYSIYMLDLDGKVTNWNLGAQRIKGYRAEEIIGEHFSLFYTDEDRALGLPKIALVTAARKGRFEQEGLRVRKDGSRFLANVVIDPIRNDIDQIVGFAKITKDITEQRETQRALEEAREALFQSQKMEAIGQLTGGIALDFNNLLTGITGSLELMEARLAQGRFKELDRYVSVAQAAAKRAAALTHRLLAFSRRQTLDPRQTDVNRLASGLGDLMRRTVGPEIDISISTADDIWGILVDPNELENALLNLCINARDAMPDGGTLLITASNHHLELRPAEEHGLPPGNYVALCISDTGCGMPKEVAARAFEPFFTTKPVGEGTGLGLSMVYGFARQSGGRVCIDSEIGRGTKVCLYLPRHDGCQDADVSEAKLNVEQYAEKNETVLVVDDEPAVRMLITEVLKELRYSPLEAEDGLSGLKILETDRPIHLLITDVGLPGGLTGRQIADAALQFRPDLRVLFITGYAESAIARNAGLQSGMHVLSKPFSIEELRNRIKAVLTGVLPGGRPVNDRGIPGAASTARGGDNGQAL